MSAVTASSDVAVVILAGGRGTRLQRVLSHLPKPMAPAAGRPFLEWIVRHLARGGFSRVWISTGHLAKVIEDHFASEPVPGVRVQCVPEDQPLGTAGAFLHVFDRSGIRPKAWLVLNGDSLVFVDWANLLAGLDRSAIDGVLVARSMEDVGRFGRLNVDSAGQVRGFAEKDVAFQGAGLISAGVYLLRDSLLADAPSQRPLSFEQDLFPRWLGQGRAFQAHVADSDFLDIGTEQTLVQADNFIRRHRDRFLGPL